MPSLDNIVAPEYQGKVLKGDETFLNTMESMYKQNGKYKVVILDPNEVKFIPHAPTFFERPTVPENSCLESQIFNSGRDAFAESKALLDKAIESHIKKGNQTFQMYALVLSKTKSGNNLVNGFIQAEVGKSSTKYLVAKNPHDTCLNVVKESEQSRV